MHGFDDAALRYLILAANSRQDAFQFEFVPFDESDEFIAPLLGRNVVPQVTGEGMVAFHLRQRRHLVHVAETYNRRDEPPNHFQILSRVTFQDNYYYTSNRAVAVIAMGNWKRQMAPPSILEFIQLLVLQDAMFGVCPELSTHMGTRGCLFDFCASLSDARQNVLSGSICKLCQAVMSDHGHGDLVNPLLKMLSRDWIGNSQDPASPAGITSKLGHDLFLTKGLKPNPIESMKMTFAQESAKIIPATVAVLIAAALAFYLGLKAG